MLLTFIVVTSCGIHKNVRLNEVSIINSHYEQMDILSLIKDLNLYPAYRDEAEEALFNKIDYSRYGYDELDFRAAAFFDSLKVNCESSALDVIANTNIEGTGTFYKNHSDLRKFLRPYICKAYFTGLDTLDYQSLKALYKSFGGTDLGDLAYPRYKILRDTLLEEITESLDKYFITEGELLEDIEYSIRVLADDYVKKGTKSITQSLVEKNSRNIFQKIFKREEQDRYSFRNYANILINTFFDSSYITNEVSSRIDGYIKTSTEYRLDICHQYINKIDDGMFISNTLNSHKLNWEVGRSHIDNVQDIKDTGTALTVGSMALGFVPGIGAVAVAADVIDLAYGLSQDSQINEAMTELTNALYGDSLVCIEEYLQDIFGDIRHQMSKSANNIKITLYEEF